MVEKLSYGLHYSESFFNKSINQKNKNIADVDMSVSKWGDDNQHQCHHEAIQWMGHNFNEIEGMCLKKEKFSIQSGVKRYG